ncbi:hypothetical protein R8Z50_22830 [Longispora sp. K20-0274]|uniref:hypothetical protein n=1 Tax=Longispora sp. K20-0274 TaxID=3088255 RepID=UPI00399A435C
MTSPFDIAETVNDGEFPQRCPALARWSLPVLRVVLRTLGMKYGLTKTPVIAAGDLVWCLDQQPMLLRPHARHNGPLPLVQLEPDGPAVMVWPEHELADACALLVDSVIDPPPPAPDPVNGSHIIPAGSAVRDHLVLLNRLDLEAASPTEITSLLAVLAVAAHHQHRVLQRLRTALTRHSPPSADPEQAAACTALRHTALQLGPTQHLLAQLQQIFDDAHRLLGAATRRP